MFLAFVAAIMLTSWGGAGHAMISFRISLSFNEDMAQFGDWIFYLSEHASDADKRKNSDPEEGPKHYIDIDNYDTFVTSGRIPHSLDSCIAIYGEEFVEENGYLPWATLAMYDSLVSNLTRGDITSAKKYAADLGHYVADGHMPLHLTRNYDGQFTGNKGIHSRYESQMISIYQDKITYSGTPAEEIENVRRYVFDYIYKNYTCLDSILIADDYAKEMGSGTSSDLYYVALWEKTERITNQMFSGASHSFAELIYSAWIEAGKPSFTETSAKVSSGKSHQNRIQIIPNPLQSEASVIYNFHMEGNVTATIYDTAGRATFHGPVIQTGREQQTFALNTGQISNGTYYIVLGNSELKISAPFLIYR